MTWPQRRVVRYYAFVPDAADPLSGRGEADSFLHDVSLALEGVGLRRGGYGNDLHTKRTVLQGQLAAAGERWRNTGEVTVIVVDGLTTSRASRTRRGPFIEELPPPAGLPEGVFVVLGTQTTGILPPPISRRTDPRGPHGRAAAASAGRGPPAGRRRRTRRVAPAKPA